MLSIAVHAFCGKKIFSYLFIRYKYNSNEMQTNYLIKHLIWKVNFIVTVALCLSFKHCKFSFWIEKLLIKKWLLLNMTSSNVALSIDSFGSVVDHITKEEKEVKRFTWNNSKSNVSVQVTILTTSSPALRKLYWKTIMLSFSWYRMEQC